MSDEPTQTLAELRAELAEIAYGRYNMTWEDARNWAEAVTTMFPQNVKPE